MRIKDRIVSRYYATPQQYDVIVYTENNHYYAKDERGNTICIDSPTACLQESVNYLRQFGGGSILVKKGMYYPTRIVYIPNGINLLIEGEGNSTVFRYTDLSTLFRHVPSTPTWTSVLIFRNLKIDRTGSGTNKSIDFFISYAKYVKYENIEIVDDYRDTDGDVGLYGFNNFVVIAEKNRIYGKGAGISLYGHIVVLRENYVENNARAGIIGAGFLPNATVPPGYYGGITIIEDNICVDCGRTDEAIAVDYWVVNPVQEAIGVIRNNLIMTKNYSMKSAIAITRATHIIVEGNKVIGSVSAVPVGVQWFNPIKYLVLRNNIINVNQVSATIKSIILANTVIVEGNEINVTSSLDQNTGAWTEIWADYLVFKNNKISISPKSGYTTEFILQTVPLGNANLYAVVENNYFDAPTNGAPIRFGGTSPVVRYVWFMRNIINNTTYTDNFLLLSGSDNDITYYVVVRDNVVLGTLRNRIAINNYTSGKTTTAIIDTDVGIANWGNAIFKFAKRYAGYATFSGDGTTTQFRIQHNLVSTPRKIIVTPASKDAASQFYVTADYTYIYVNYLTAPPQGTNNVVLSWYAEV